MQINNNQEFEEQNIGCSIRPGIIPRGEIIECDYKSNDECNNDEQECNDDSLNEYEETFLDMNSEILDDNVSGHNYECEHNYVIDLIDVDPERSQIIEYCDKCFHVID
jgi:hypothetical protein